MRTMNNRNEEENRNSIDLDELVCKMKTLDKKQSKAYRSFYITMIVLAVIYILMLVINPDSELELYYRFSGLCYVTAFVIGAFWYRREQIKVTQIDYAAPLLEVLKGALDRYWYFRKGTFSFLWVLLFIDLGFTTGSTHRYLPESWPLWEKILILQVIYWGIMLLTVLIGYLFWKKKLKPYRDAVNQMISELEAEE